LRASPELPKILGVTLSVRVDAKEIIGLQHVHPLAYRPRVSPARVGEIQPQRQVVREAPQGLFGVVFAAVFADDKSDIGSWREFIIDFTTSGFDTLAFIMNWQQDFYVGNAPTTP
jgi:hypothetical protein